MLGRRGPKFTHPASGGVELSLQRLKAFGLKLRPAHGGLLLNLGEPLSARGVLVDNEAELCEHAGMAGRRVNVSLGCRSPIAARGFGDVLDGLEMGVHLALVETKTGEG